MEEMIDVVDNEDRVIRKAGRKEVMENALLHRVAYVIIIDGEGKVLVHKRAASKDIYPGVWDIGAGETVKSRESYETAAIRGLKEELGIKSASNQMKFLFKCRYGSPGYNSFNQVYKVLYKGKPSPNPDEIDEVRFIKAKDVKALIDKGNFADDGAAVFRQFTLLDALWAAKMEELVDIVDENDRFVRKATRDEMMEKGLLNRAARVIVVNGKGEYLVHKRAAAKKRYPGRWDIGIAETLVSGEGYEAAAIRGLAEELGIHGVSNIELKRSLLFKLRYASEINNAWIKVYRIAYDGAITPQAEEMEAAQFLPLKGVIELSKGDNFSPSGKFVLDNYLEVGPY